MAGLATGNKNSSSKFGMIVALLLIGFALSSCGYHRTVSKETSADSSFDGGDKPKTSAEKNLFELIESGDIENLRLRIAQGSDLALTNEKGQSLIMWAVVWNQKEIIELLLQEGINLEVRDQDGRTIFEYRDISEQLVVFIEAWQMREELQAEFKEALVIADFKRVSELLELGVSPSVRYEGGATALILVLKIADPKDRGSYRNFRRVIQALLKLDTNRKPVYEVDLNAKDDFGKSALDWAKEKGDRGLVRNLEMIGAL